MYSCVMECKSNVVLDQLLDRWMKVMELELLGGKIADGFVRMGGS